MNSTHIIYSFLMFPNSSMSRFSCLKNPHKTKILHIPHHVLLIVQSPAGVGGAVLAVLDLAAARRVRVILVSSTVRNVQLWVPVVHD